MRKSLSWTFLVPLPLLGCFFVAWLNPGLSTGPFVWLDFTPAAVIMAVYVALLGTFVHRYAVVSLAGEYQSRRFLRNLVGTLWAVQGLALAGNMVLFIVFWMLTSLVLHRLLEHYRHRRAARVVAWEKFLVSRFGDVCLIGSAILLGLSAGTLNFTELSRLPLQGVQISWAAGLLALGALSKSAQVPFHGWLPRTLEAPTPVSALLHAGVINAGGFLLIRFSFIIAHHPEAQLLVLLAGSLSALWGGLAMIVQPDVKRRLAWSTVGQMGFMMIELGLGSPGLALVHLMGHGLYKAKSFLWSGDSSLVKTAPPAQRLGLWRPWVGGIVWAGILGVNLVVLAHWAPSHLVLSCVVWAALLPLVVGAWERPSGLFRSLLAGVLVLAASTLLALGAEQVLQLPEYAPHAGLRAFMGWGAALLLAFTGLVTALHPFLAKFTWYRKAYASALHGFSLGRWPEALVDRWSPGAKVHHRIGGQA